MIAVHIEDKPDEIIVSRLDCVVSRYEKSALYVGDEVVFLVDTLRGLGHVVEMEGC